MTKTHAFVSVVFFLSVRVWAAENCTTGVKTKKPDGTILLSNSIQDSINNAPSGSLITVGSGTYSEKIKVKDKQNLTLLTECSAVLESISFTNSTLIAVKGFSFQPKSNGEDYITLHENNSHLVFDRMIISSKPNDGNRRNGVRIDNSNQSIYILNSEIKHNGKNGISASGEKTSFVIKGSILQSNGMNGILLQSEARMISLSNIYKDNGARHIPEANYAIARETSLLPSCADVLTRLNSFEGTTDLFKNRSQICADPDSDSDGIPDLIDNHPAIFNPDQKVPTNYPVALGMTALGSNKYSISPQNSNGFKYIVEKSQIGSPESASFGGVVYKDEVQVFMGRHSFQHLGARISDLSISTVVPATSSVSAFDVIGTVYEMNILGSGYQFNEPVQVTLKIPSTLSFEDLAKLNISVYSAASNSWEDLGGVIDPVTRTITAKVPHFSWITAKCKFCKKIADDPIGQFAGFIHGASVTLEDAWNGLIVNGKGLFDFLGDIISGDRDLVEQIKNAINQCSDIGPYWDRIRGLSPTEEAASMGYASVAMNWMANCASHLITGQPEYVSTYPSSGISHELKIPMKRAILEMWSKQVYHDGDLHDALWLCDGLVVEDEENEGGRKHCNTGDALIFSSLLDSAASRADTQQSIRRAVDPDGRPWRSAESMAAPKNSHKDFSKDAMLGLLVYLAKNRDRELAARVKDYLVEHNNLACPYQDTTEAFSQCYITPNLISMLDRVLNMTGGGGREPSAAEVNIYDEMELRSIVGRKKESSFQYHLSGTSVYLRHLTGTMTSKTVQIAKELYYYDPQSLFFKYLYKLTDPSAPFSYDSIADELMTAYMEGWVRSSNNASEPGFYNTTPNGRSQWVWNRPTKIEEHKPESKGWDYLFIAALLDPGLKIYKEGQDFSTLTLPPPGMYLFSGLFETNYYILFPGNIEATRFDHKFCKVNYGSEHLAFLKGWGVTNKSWNAGATYILNNPTVQYIGDCLPPIIAEAGNDNENFMSDDRVLDLTRMAADPYRMFEFSVQDRCYNPYDPDSSETCQQSALNCQKACLIDRECKGVNLFIRQEGDNLIYQCRMLSRLGNAVKTGIEGLGLVNTSRKYPVTPLVQNSGEIGCTTSRTSATGVRKDCDATQCYSVQSPLGYIDFQRSLDSLVYHDEQGSEHVCTISATQQLNSNWVTEICLTAHARSHSGHNAGPGRVYCSFDVFKFE